MTRACFEGGPCLLPAGSVLTTHSMALKKHRSFEAQLDSRDVNGILHRDSSPRSFISNGVGGSMAHADGSKVFAQI